jgi:hypothetical protein
MAVTVTSPANRSFLCQNHSPFLFLDFGGIASTIGLKLFLHVREVLFETRQLFQGRGSFGLETKSINQNM